MDYISVIGMGHLYSVARLMEALLELKLDPPGDLATPVENGYSVGIVALSVLFAESAIRRTAQIRSDADPWSALDYSEKAFPEYERIHELEEVFVLRDVVVHNHIWGLEISWDIDGNVLFGGATRLSKGNRRLASVVDEAGRKTKRLGLNLLPTAISHIDALKVFTEAIRFVMWLESTQRLYFPLSDQVLKFQGRAMRLGEFLGQLKESLTPVEEATEEPPRD